MRDTSVPTPAIVDSRLIEAPFEVAMKASQSRRYDEAESQSLSEPGDRNLSSTTSLSAAQRREQRRVAKEAEKEATRQAKIDAKRHRAEQKLSARDAKINSEPTPHVADSEEPLASSPAPSEHSPAPRSASSFDELMGYTQP